MEKVTQTTAATAEESAAASEELNAQAEASMHSVRTLEEMVGGAAATPAPADDEPGDEAQGARVVTIQRASTAAASAAPGAPAARKPTAEEQIPLEDTGTYGRF
jgi:methyl-accepting chemotaxis protein